MKENKISSTLTSGLGITGILAATQTQKKRFLRGYIPTHLGIRRTGTQAFLF